MSAVLACLAAGVFVVLEAMSRPAMTATKKMAMMPTALPMALKNGSISACCHLGSAPQVRHQRLVFADCWRQVRTGASQASIACDSAHVLALIDAAYIVGA
jgi:hypothetical protein